MKHSEEPYDPIMMKKAVLVAYGIVFQILFDVVILLLLIVSLTGCATQSKLDYLKKNSVGAQINIPQQQFLPNLDATQSKRDTLTVHDLDGREMIIMKAIKDENGEMVASDVIDAAVVTARFRNVAERNGRVSIEFQVCVPEKMQDPQWQLRFFPKMHILEDTLSLEPVIITGGDYRRAQLRGYEQYERFLSSIITDSTKFINIHLLEVFIKRNIPNLYKFKTDSSYVSDEVFVSYYGVSEQQAIDHYTNSIAKNWNERRKAKKTQMYNRYVKVPIDKNVRLDTVIRQPSGDFIYNYVQTFYTRPKLRRVEIVLEGDIYEQEKKLYTIPASDPLTFYISSLSAFVDGTERYMRKIIERKVDASTACYIEFAQGKSNIDIAKGNNYEEISRIKENLASLIQNEVFDLDSIVVTASSSPEGSLALNTKLTKSRSTAVSDYFNAYITDFQDSLRQAKGVQMSIGEVQMAEDYPTIKFISKCDPENWRSLNVLIDADDTLTEDQKKEYRDEIVGIRNLDQREKELSKKPYYKYLRQYIYPRLRTVKFDFHLHRKGMVKDTIHTTVLDENYMAGVQAIKDHDYEKAVTILRPYNDYNAAVAFCSLGYDASAMAILEGLPQTAQVNYMLAILYSRKGEDEKAVQHYLHSTQQDASYIHRGNLDPEISTLIGKYDINSHQSINY